LAAISVMVGTIVQSAQLQPTVQSVSNFSFLLELQAFVHQLREAQLNRLAIAGQRIA
jgi:hypothetical protein